MANDVVKKFELYNPYLSSIGIKEWRYIGNREFLFEIQDGTFCIFDNFSNITFRINGDRKNLTDEEIAKEFGHGLKIKLRNTQMTQEELAFDMGISQATISRYIRGKTLPTYEIMRKICIIFNCSMDDFSYDRAFR